MRDFNARVGESDCVRNIITGKFSLGKRNGIGKDLLRDLIIAKPFF